MKESIQKIIEEHTDIYGFLRVKDYVSSHKQNSKNGYFDNYLFLSPYKTIITLAFPYPKKDTEYKGKGYGLLTRFSYSNDYHTVIMKKLNDIIKKLKILGINGVGSVDISNLDEKFAAYLSGLGYFGKHSILIHPTLGSYFFIGTILIDQELAHSSSIVQNTCGDCTRCIDACPSNALDNGFERSKCISYLSQTKMALNEEQVSYFKKYIYGCDICLKACPKNKGIDLHLIEEFEPNGIENIFLEDLLFMSKKEFHNRFKTNTSHWIGVSTMRRNAISIIANQKLKELIPKIQESKSVYKDNLWYNKTADIVLKKLESE